MKKNEAEELGRYIMYCLENDKEEDAFERLMPALQEKNSFQILDTIAQQFHGTISNDIDQYFRFFDYLSSRKEMGGYVIIAQAMIGALESDRALCFRKAKEYLIEGDEWYVCDIIGERVLGHALIYDTQKTLPFFKEYVVDENHWVRRSVGVAVHLFAKRCRNSNETVPTLLHLLEPQLEEKDMRVIKGVGWGLKTVGRYYPEYLVDYMTKQVYQKKISAVIIRKCLTYLPEPLKDELRLEYDNAKNGS